MKEGIINFYAENDFVLEQEDVYERWLKGVASSEDCHIGELNYIFCDDEYLLALNQKYLNHDTFTDIISFDNSLGKEINGDIFISTERVSENAQLYSVTFNDELRRVIVHGLLHCIGFMDKTAEEKEQMSRKEDEKMKMFHVEQ